MDPTREAEAWIRRERRPVRCATSVYDTSPDNRPRLPSSDRQSHPPGPALPWRPCLPIAIRRQHRQSIEPYGASSCATSVSRAPSKRRARSTRWASERFPEAAPVGPAQSHELQQQHCPLHWHIPPPEVPGPLEACCQLGPFWPPDPSVLDWPSNAPGPQPQCEQQQQTAPDDDSHLQSPWISGAAWISGVGVPAGALSSSFTMMSCATGRVASCVHRALRPLCVSATPDAPRSAAPPTTASDNRLTAPIAARKTRMLVLKPPRLPWSVGPSSVFSVAHTCVSSPCSRGGTYDCRIEMIRNQSRISGTGARN